jgi:hypothetical protein
MHTINLHEWAVERGRMLHHFVDVDPKRTALVVIDMQNAFLAEGQPLAHAPTHEIFPNVNRLIAASRKADILVCWSQRTHVETAQGNSPTGSARNICSPRSLPGARSAGPSVTRFTRSSTFRLTTSSSTNIATGASTGHLEECRIRREAGSVRGDRRRGRRLWVRFSL